MNIFTKYCLILLVVLLIPFEVIMGQEPGDGFSPSSTVTVDERIHNFGLVNESDGIVSHPFTITNTGSTPVVIVRAKFGCTCISVDYPKIPVQAGKTAKITISFNPYYRPGPFSKEITLVFADKTYRKIWVKGDVSPMVHPVSENNPYGYGNGIWMNLAKVVLGYLHPDGQKTMKLRIANDNDNPVKITFQLPPEASIDLRLPPSVTIGPKGEATIKVTGIGHMAFSGIRSTMLTILVDGKPLKQKLEITAHGTLQ